MDGRRRAAPAHRLRARRRVSLWPNLSGGEAIDLLTRLRGGTDRQGRLPRAQATAAARSSSSTRRKKGRTYSKGNRQKVALIAAFATPAELYILDEPTSGLDPLMEAVFRARSTASPRDGATVLLSSHILSEVEQLCDRVSIIRAGRTVETGTLAELRHLTRTEIVVRTPPRRRPGRRIPGAHDVIVAAAGRFTVDSDRVAGVLPALARCASRASPSRRPRSRSSSCGTTATSSPRSGWRASASGRMTSCLVLLRQRIRRDRLQLALWIVGTALLAYAVGQRGVRDLRRAAGPTRDPRRRDRRPAPSSSSAARPAGTTRAVAFFLLFAWLAMLAAS